MREFIPPPPRWIFYATVYAKFKTNLTLADRIMRMAEQNAKILLEQQFLEMRWRLLSLAADLDRVQRAAGGADVLRADPQAQKIREALSILGSDAPNRAERFQMLFSDMTPPPK